MPRNDESIREIYIRALAHLLKVVVATKNNLENGINDFNKRDLEKYEGGIRQLKAQYEEGQSPNAPPFLCKALEFYKEYLEKSKSILFERLGVALPDLAHTNDEIAFIEDGIDKVCV